MSSFFSCKRSRLLYNFSLSLDKRKASFIFYQLQQICGFETNSSYRHRLVRPSSRQTMQQSALSQSPMLMLFPLRQFCRSQGFFMFFRYIMIQAWRWGEAGKLYQCRNDWKVLAFSMAAWEWKGTCSPFRFISNITFSPHLQQVKVVGSLLAMRATYQYTQLSSLTLQTYSGTNQLYPLTSSYDVQKEVSHFAKARLSTALITLGQKPYGFERVFQSWPLRPSRKSLRRGLFYDLFNWDQSQAFIIIINHQKSQQWSFGHQYFTYIFQVNWTLQTFRNSYFQFENSIFCQLLYFLLQVNFQYPLIETTQRKYLDKAVRQCRKNGNSAKVSQSDSAVKVQVQVLSDSRKANLQFIFHRYIIND